MLRRPRAFATLLVALMPVLAAAPSAMAATTSKTTPRSRTVAASSTAPPTPKAYVLVDADTGTVLAASGEHTPLPPASTVKIMTGLTALRRLPPDATIKVSARAAAQPAMRIGMHEGEVWPLNDVLHTLYMVSANDSAYALAEAAGGTVENFATEMDDTAKQLGMVDSSFNDPAGLDDAASVKGGSHMSAWDLAIAARNALAVPQIADVVKLLDYKFTGPDGVPHSLHNHNATFLQHYPGATGMKTGYTEKAGRGLVCTATRNGRTMIGVVLDIYDNTGTCEHLMDQGFASKPDAVGTGEQLPAVKIFTAVDRQHAIDSIPRLLGRPALSALAGTPTTAVSPTTAGTPTTSAAKRAERVKSTRPKATTRQASAFPVRNAVAVVVVVVLLVGLVIWRRRVVKRQRKLRIARQKELAVARRRGMLQVLDPDAQPGNSHVSVIRKQRTG